MAPAVEKWKGALQDNICENWNTYDYLNGSKPMNIDDIVGNVNAAVQNKHTEVIPASPPPPLLGNPAPPTYVYTYGADVCKFIDDWSKQIGVATGRKPDNVKYYIPNPFGCFMAGTKVMLSNGQNIGIEDVQDGMKILSHGGTISTCTNEDVANLMSEGETVYGFNEENAFFSAGHAFWTTEGWKAIAPDIAREETLISWWELYKWEASSFR